MRCDTECDVNTRNVVFREAHCLQSPTEVYLSKLKTDEELKALAKMALFYIVWRERKLSQDYVQRGLLFSSKYYH